MFEMLWKKLVLSEYLDLFIGGNLPKKIKKIKKIKNKKSHKPKKRKRKAKAMETPAMGEFAPEPHWIRSDRCSSGFKGVMKDSRRGWRVKYEGSTIGRFASKAAACEAYYQYAGQVYNS